MIKKSITIALLLSAMTFDSKADINFSGFSTVVGGITSGEDEKFEGFDDSFNLANGSLFGVQATSDLGDGFGATVQFLSKGANDWDLKFSWAYLSYDVNDDFRFLFGRQRAPFYMYSDYLDVSYAYHWISPPAGVYDAIFDTFDGVGAVYSTAIGDSYLTAHLSIGENSDQDTPVSDTKLHTEFADLIGGSLTWNLNWLTLRTAYFQGALSIPLEDAEVGTLVNGLYQLQAGWASTPFTSVANSIEVLDEDVTFVELGAQIDYGNWLAVAEYTEVDTGDSVFPQQTSWFTSVGHRFDNVMLHVTYGVNEDASDDKLSSVPNGIPAIDGLKAATQNVLDTLSVDEPFYTLGVRWDFHDSIAFKAEYTKTEDDGTDTDINLIQFALVSVF